MSETTLLIPTSTAADPRARHAGWHCPEQLCRAAARTCSHPALLGGAFLSLCLSGHFDRVARPWRRGRVRAPQEKLAGALRDALAGGATVRPQLPDRAGRAGDRVAHPGFTGAFEGEFPAAHRDLPGFGRAFLCHRTGILRGVCPPDEARLPALRRRPRRRRAGLPRHRSSAQLAGRSQHRALCRHVYGAWLEWCGRPTAGRETERPPEPPSCSF